MKTFETTSIVIRNAELPNAVRQSLLNILQKGWNVEIYIDADPEGFHTASCPYDVRKIVGTYVEAARIAETAFHKANYEGKNEEVLNTLRSLHNGYKRVSAIVNETLDNLRSELFDLVQGFSKSLSVFEDISVRQALRYEYSFLLKNGPSLFAFLCDYSSQEVEGFLYNTEERLELLSKGYYKNSFLECYTVAQFLEHSWRPFVKAYRALMDDYKLVSTHK